MTGFLTTITVGGLLPRGRREESNRTQWSRVKHDTSGKPCNPDIYIHRMDAVSREVGEAMDRFLDTVVRYRCVDREATVSHCRVIQAILDRLYQEGLVTQQAHYTGSMFEGMPQEVCSDQDLMYTRPTYPVVVLEPPGDSKQHQSGFVEAHGNPDQPAYLRLKVTDKEGIKNEYTKLIDINSFVSSELFVAGIVTATHVAHGPAATGLAAPSHPDKGKADHVYCLHCPSWPPCTSEFLTRPRPHGWPSQSLIDKIQQAGCHVVGVGHPHSDNKDIEWRWSFSVAEKELIHDMCDTMAGVMYLLKAVKKKHWTKEDLDKPTTFCSYYIKTACLWVCEETDQSNTAIMDLCRQVIDWLVTYYRTHTLPHYFIRGQNLIGHLSQDMCKEVHDWLVCVRDDLCRMILSSVEMVGHLPAVIRYMCRQLQVSPVSSDCDYRELVSTLCVHDRAREVLEEATNTIIPGSDIYRQWERFGIGYWSSNDFNFIYRVIHDQLIKDSLEPSVVITIPETILLPIIGNMHAVVKDGYGAMFRQALYRHMGDCYSSLYAHLSDIDSSLTMTCHDKAVHYYTLGREMVYPDGWSDKGLGGYVRLATLYYLSGQWSQLEASLKELEPLLEESKESVEAINGQSCTVLQTNIPRSLCRWKADTDIYSLISTWDDLDVDLHPVPLGYYILARFALRQGDREGATRALHNIEGCVDLILNIAADKSTRCMIHILKQYRYI